MAEYLVQTDIIVSLTSAPHVIIDRAMVQDVMRARKGRPMFFIDIAVPRDIDPAVNTLGEVFLYDIDDLEHVERITNSTITPHPWRYANSWRCRHRRWRNRCGACNTQATKSGA